MEPLRKSLAWNPQKTPQLSSISETSTAQKQLRLRVFAGPNGSGKSTVIEDVKAYRSKGKLIDFGYYINADDITSTLKNTRLFFQSFDLQVTNQEFREVALSSGLIGKEFSEEKFKKSYTFYKNSIKLKDASVADRVAQIIADFLRKKLLRSRKKFSFETVFSHPSKLDIMRDAAAAGYKVYLYFVSTESPLINKFRVSARKEKGGHDVPTDKIESRYYRSLDLLYNACQLAYQAYFFDNSNEGVKFRMFAHFKKTGASKKWDKMTKKDVPNWFMKYYVRKVSKS